MRSRKGEPCDPDLLTSSHSAVQIMGARPVCALDQGLTVRLYTVPRAYRSQFLQGRPLGAAESRSIRQRQSNVVQAVVAPPKKSKELPPFEAWNTGAAVKKRTDIKTILILGPGPIIIGQVKNSGILYAGAISCP